MHPYRWYLRLLDVGRTFDITIEDALVGAPISIAHQQYDTVVCAHVLEHISLAKADELVEEFVPRIRHGGHFIAVTCQRVGFVANPLAVTYYSPNNVGELLKHHGLFVEKLLSFPFPWVVGNLLYAANETIGVGFRP